MPEISEQMKRDNWAFYVLARSDDTKVKISYTRALISSLINAMRITNETQHNQTLLTCLHISNDAAAKAWKDGDEGAARQDCETVLDQITFLIYDKRWATSQPDSFKMPPKEKVT